MLFEGLPTELIIHNLQFLSFEDIKNLAWTNRRIMKIVQRNLPEALHPKIEARCLSIRQPPKFVMSMFGLGPIDELPEAKHDFEIIICSMSLGSDAMIMRNDTTDLQYSFEIPVNVSDSKDNTRSKLSDQKLLDLFNDYCQYRRNTMKQKGRIINWNEYAHVKGADFGEDGQFPLPLDLVLSQFACEDLNIFITDFKEEKYLNLVNTLDKTRSTIKSAYIEFKTPEILAENISKSAELSFINSGKCTISLANYRILENELPQYLSLGVKQWRFSCLAFDQMSFLLKSSVPCAKVDNGCMSLSECILDLLQTPPKFDRRHFKNTRNEDGKWDFSTIEEILTNSQTIYWSVEDIPCELPTNETVDIQCKRYEIIAKDVTWYLQIDNYSICGYFNSETPQRMFNLDIMKDKSDLKSSIAMPEPTASQCATM